MFDPYRKWLGIPVKDQPPNHYRLLGLELYESDLDVIEGAADRLMSFVRQYQSGEQAAEAAKLLNELSIARLCLMKPATKAAYDKQLGQQLAAAQEPSASDFSDVPIAELQPRRARSKKQAGQSPKVNLNLLIIGGVALVVCVVAVVLMSPRRPNPPVDQPNQIAKASPAATGQNELPAVPVVKPEAVPANNLVWPVQKLVSQSAGAPIDLLKLVDLPRDVAQGDWQQAQEAVIGKSNSVLYLPSKAPEDYQLQLKVRRLEGNEGLTIGFMMAGRQGAVALDGWNGTLSGLYVDGREPKDNCTTHKGKLFQGASAADIVLTVHPGHLLVKFDNTTVVDWHGDPERLFLYSGYGIGSRESAFISTAAKVVIESVKLTPLKPEPPLPQLKRLDKEIDVLPLMDPDRDSERGIWSLNKNTLSSPEGFGQAYLPTVVPEEYTLSMTVEMPANAPDHATMGIGLPVGRSICQLTIVNNDCMGIDTIDSRRWNENDSRRSGTYLKRDVPTRIDCTVTKGRIRCEFNNRTLIDWRGESTRLSRPMDWFLADSRRLSLGAHHHLRFRDIKLGPPKAPPPLPDHPSFSVGQAVDLLALVDPDRDAINGKWERDGKSVVIAEGIGMSRLLIPSEIPAEYKLTMRVARTAEDGDKELDISLPFANSQADVVVDSSSTTGMHLDNLNTPDNITTYRQLIMTDATPVDLTFFVRKTGLKLVSGEKTIFDWVGNPLRATWHWARTAPHGRISIGSWNQKYRFESLTLEELPPSDFPKVPELGSDGKLLPILDVKRDSRRGEWTLDSEGLLSPQAGLTRIQIPVAPPSQYLLTANVERRAGNDDLFLGLVVGGHDCAVTIDGDGGKTVALELLDGKQFRDRVNFTRRKFDAPLLPAGKPTLVRCYVLPDSIVVKCGDTEVLRWHGDARRLSPEPTHFPARYIADDRSKLWLATHKTSFQIRDLELKTLTDAEAKEIKHDQPDVFPVKPFLEVTSIGAPPPATQPPKGATADASESWLLKRGPEARALLVMNESGDQQAAIEACRHVRLPFDMYPEFPKTDYSRYSLVVVGTNMMDAWGQPANQNPAAFQPLVNFIQSGGHLLVFNTYNGRNMENLVPLGITTGVHHTSAYEKVPGISDIFFNGSEDLVPAGNHLQQAGNFTVQKPHVVLLKRGSGANAGEPTVASLRHGSGRLTYSSVEPGYGNPTGYWLLQVAIRWAARGGPVTAGDLEQASKTEAEILKRPLPRGKKLEILDARYGLLESPVVITPAVIAGAKSGRLMMVVDTSLIGNDPKFGTPKFLQMRYRYNGIEEFRFANGHEAIIIGSRAAAENVTGDNFKLIEVRFGTGIYSSTNGIDVTRQFRPLVTQNGLNPTREQQDQALAGLPDPKPYVPKSMYVIYQYQGKEQAAIFAAGGLIAVGDPPAKQ